MKIKQVLATIGISALTTLAVVWGYGNFMKHNNSFAGQQNGVIPSNYRLAGLTEGGSTPPGAVDFTQPASAALPAVVHIKTKTHQKWLSDLNTNKMNFYTECEKLKEVVNSQKIIIAKMENELNIKIKTIDYLSQQLMVKDTSKNDMIDLLSFD